MAQVQTITANQQEQQGTELASLGALGKLRELLQRGKELYQKYGKSAGLGLAYGATVGYSSGMSPWSLEGQAAIEAAARAYQAKGATPDQVAAFKVGATIGMEAGRLAKEAGVGLNNITDIFSNNIGIPPATIAEARNLTGEQTMGANGKVENPNQEVVPQPRIAV
jgi:hypothetical protein